MTFFNYFNIKSKTILANTVYLSLIIQIITGILQIHGLTFHFEKNEILLRDVLALETVVQIVEAMFYTYIAYSISTIDTKLVTPMRYFDWAITTPTMLVSTIMFMEYTKQVEKKVDTKNIQTGTQFIKENKENVTKIVVYNAFMLLFGYLAETNSINKYIGNVAGFFFFGLSFYTIYSNYAYTNNTTTTNQILFNLMLGIWSLYGVAALFPTIMKNVRYNILDLFSKNFYGLFVYYTILKMKELI